ncbi:MAG: TldD/PmbA family protein [Pseudomonadota bacterium]
MLTKIPAEKIIAKALSYGATFAEIFIEQSITNSIVNDDKRLENIFSSTDAGVGIRVLQGTKTAYGSTNDFSRLSELAETVAKAAKKNFTHPASINFKETNPRLTIPIALHPTKVSMQQKIETVLRAADVAWGAGSAICQVRVLYKDKVRQIEIINSDGFIAKDEQVETVFYVQAVASKGDVLQTGYEPVGGGKGFEIFETKQPEKIAALASKRAIQMLDAKPAKAGPMTVVLSSTAGGTMIHEAVGHGLEGDLAVQGLSVYNGRIGEKVASSLITVYDDATLVGHRGSFVFDDEGTPSQKTCLIEKGVLKGYLADRVTALKSNAISTGNGRRQSYAHVPMVRMTNTIIAPGQDDPEKILQETKTGLFVTRMGGGQVNTVNGDFTFEVQEGYEIENGKIGQLVRGASLIGNGPKILENIDRVGNDLGFSIGTCGKNSQEVPVESAQPTIRIPEIVVGGK